MKRLLALLSLVMLAACKGADGPMGPAGPAGPQGPQGPVGPQGPANGNMVTMTGLVTSTSVDLLLPASATAAKLPAFTCYISDRSTGPWLSVPAPGSSTSAPYCGVVVRTDGRVEIRLRQWISGWWYYVTAVWPT